MKSITSKLFLKLFFCCVFATTIRAENALSVFGRGQLQTGEIPVYVNLNAPKGGAITNGVLGSFDTLNPFNLKGVAGPEIRHFTIESLMKRHMDEPFALYPSLAKNFTLNGNVLRFELQENATFSDGEKLNASHVITSFNLLKNLGRPNFRTYYDKVSKIEALGEKGVAFHLSDLSDKELPLILALMPIFKMTMGVDFKETTLTPLIGTGAYSITGVKIGERLTFTRNNAWWGKDLNLNVGQQNFETLHFDFYRDSTAFLEAFKKGLIDWRLEREPQKWQDLQNSEQVKRGDIVLHEITTKLPLPFRAYHFNTRRDQLKPIEVRKALHLLFDGEAINTQLFLGKFHRLSSSFERSELQGSNVFPKMNERERLREALRLFNIAGFTLKNGVLASATGNKFTLEFIVNSKDQERLAYATCQNFLKVGVACNIRLLDSAQYQAKSQAFDYDVIEHTLTNSLSPGNEQLFYWSSKVADEAGSRNYSGLKSIEIDTLINEMLNSTTRDELIVRTKAFDKKLMESFVTLPLFQPPTQWIALHKHIKMPVKQSIYGYLPETWWRN